MEIEEFKKDYEVLMKKYKLPSFEKMNSDFEIGKIDRNDGSLLRTVRKIVMDKIGNSIGFFDMLLNPVNAPRMYYIYLRAMTTEDKEKVEKMYSLLSSVALDAFEREVDYSEESEAALINRASKIWDEVKPDFLQLLKKMKAPQDYKRREKSYFG